MKKNSFLKSVLTLLILSIFIVAVGTYFVSSNHLIGPVFIVLGFITTGLLKFFKVELKTVYPDIVFGAIDNGVLVFATILGGIYAGVFGAVIGGVAGNTITDGIGGLFEGRMAEKLRIKNVFLERSSMSSMLGKMIGCLFGAGIGLVIVGIINLF